MSKTNDFIDLQHPHVRISKLWLMSTTFNFFNQPILCGYFESWKWAYGNYWSITFY